MCEESFNEHTTLRHIHSDLTRCPMSCMLPISQMLLHSLTLSAVLRPGLKTVKAAPEAGATSPTVTPMTSRCALPPSNAQAAWHHACHACRGSWRGCRCASALCGSAATPNLLPPPVLRLLRHRRPQGGGADPHKADSHPAPVETAGRRPCARLNFMVPHSSTQTSLTPSCLSGTAAEGVLPVPTGPGEVAARPSGWWRILRPGPCWPVPPTLYAGEGC